jgi:8-oxo-dGTP pyrophosphatase MutT (NUDIX family)
MASMLRKGVAKSLQFYWRRTRALTMGAQGIVLDADNRVLLIRHTYRPGWHFPGGGVEKGETAELSVTRELEEEAGIVCNQRPELFGLYANFRAFPSDHIALFVVRAWTQGAIPLPNQEIAEQTFAAPEALPSGTTGAVERRLNEVLSGAERSAHW